MNKRLMNKQQKRKQWKLNNPDKAVWSKLRLKHPFVVCCYHANGNFRDKRHNKFFNKDTFVKLKPFDLWKLAKKQKCKCAITGLKLTPMNVSVDHIIPRSKGGGHTVDNLRLVHRDINHMKNHYSDDYFLEMCKLVSTNFQQTL
jgi:5-methylcytosine-specific restriction endonuclease McrA